jgi:hypothetical protein
MAVSRGWPLALLALTVLVQTGSGDEPKPLPKVRSSENDSSDTAAVLGSKVGALLGHAVSAGGAQERTWVIYSLANLGDDPALGQWIADTIPQVIEPGTWKQAENSNMNQVLRYYPPKQLLVVYHSPAAQAKVRCFLKSVKGALPESKEGAVARRMTAANERRVIRASHLAPAVMKASRRLLPPATANPEPAPAAAPKHLFHFIIRYEGAGIIDDNVIKYMKIQAGAKEDKDTSSTAAPADKKDKDSTDDAGPPPAPEGKKEKVNKDSYSPVPVVPDKTKENKKQKEAK